MEKERKTARKGLSKKVRFEIFKRDSFTCQYCGAKAPDVVLEVDHIIPVSKKGTNDLLNLVTSCKSCNSGKSDREISDNSVVEKQRSQLEDLQERREQIEMMIEWQRELSNLEEFQIEQVADYWSELVYPFELTDEGKKDLSKMLKRYELSEILEAMKISVTQYVKHKDNKPTRESVNEAWDKITGICRMRKKQEAKPYLKDLFYIRGILRNRLSYVNEWQAINLLEDCIKVGISTDYLQEHATNVHNWAQWHTELEELIEEKKK
jgi:hypothetical protein